MSIKMNITATMDAAAVTALIKDYAERQSGKRVRKVELEFRNVNKGDQRDSWQETVLNQAVIVFEDAPAVPSGPIPRSSLASQIESVERSGNQWDR